MYEKSLENATKNFPEMAEVFGMKELLKSLPREEDEKKAIKHLNMTMPIISNQKPPKVPEKIKDATKSNGQSR